MAGNELASNLLASGFKGWHGMAWRVNKEAFSKRVPVSQRSNESVERLPL
jgi:hypothetical protein